MPPSPKPLQFHPQHSMRTFDFNRLKNSNSTNGDAHSYLKKLAMKIFQGLDANVWRGGITIKCARSRTDVVDRVCCDLLHNWKNDLSQEVPREVDGN